MRIVVVSPGWDAFGGTETYLLTVCEHLQRLGHDVLVLAPHEGEITRVAADRGVLVATKPWDLEAEPEGVLVQDTASAYDAAELFPHSTRVYVAHSRDWDPQTPPQLANVCHAVVALNDRVRAHCEALSERPEIVRLRQPIDIIRFGDQALIKRSPARVLVIGNHWAWGKPGVRFQMILDVGRELGLEVERVGLPDRLTTAPETKIAESDVVIGMGRGVLEAMASRRAAYVFGIAGGDGWVTAENYPALEADGFAGTATDAVVDRARLAQDLAGFTPAMGETNRDLAIANHDAEAHTVALVALFRRIEPRPVSDGAPLAELGRLARIHWESTRRAAIATGRSRVYLAELEAARAETSHEAVERHRVQRELDQLRAAHAAVVEGRRWRLISLLASPVDIARRVASRLRARRGSPGGF
jgi:hypothetical protein